MKCDNKHGKWKADNSISISKCTPIPNIKHYNEHKSTLTNHLHTQMEYFSFHHLLWLKWWAFLRCVEHLVGMYFTMSSVNVKSKLLAYNLNCIFFVIPWCCLLGHIHHNYYNTRRFMFPLESIKLSFVYYIHVYLRIMQCLYTENTYSVSSLILLFNTQFP